MRNMFQNTLKCQGRVIDQNALHLPKPQKRLFGALRDYKSDAVQHGYKVNTNY